METFIQEFCSATSKGICLKCLPEGTEEKLRSTVKTDEQTRADL